MGFRAIPPPKAIFFPPMHTAFCEFFLHLASCHRIERKAETGLLRRGHGDKDAATINRQRSASAFFWNISRCSRDVSVSAWACCYCFIATWMSAISLRATSRALQNFAILCRLHRDNFAAPAIVAFPSLRSRWPTLQSLPSMTWRIMLKLHRIIRGIGSQACVVLGSAPWVLILLPPRNCLTLHLIC